MNSPVQRMADMPAQLPAAPESPAAERSRFFNSGNAFNIKLPVVPRQVFTSPAEAAMSGVTRLIACDQAEALGAPFPATTPLMLAHYARITSGDTLEIDFAATGTIAYVIVGSGDLQRGDEQVRWGAGDVILIPGGMPSRLSASSDAVLWLVSNAPQLALDGSLPGLDAPVDLIHYPAAEIARQVELIYQATPDETTSGIAVIFSSDRLQAARNILPSLTLSLNTLPPHTHQRGHKHNSAALTLIVQGEQCYSKVDGHDCAWAPWATLVTPPGSPHSHHNGGDKRALFLIVQDGGLHYHARTMGFEFLE